MLLLCLLLCAFHLQYPTLQVLNISGNNVPLFGRRHFARLGLTNLQRVSASRCGLVQIDSLAFVGLTNLVELDLALNDLTEVKRNAAAPLLNYTMHATKRNPHKSTSHQKRNRKKTSSLIKKVVNAAARSL